MAVCSTCGWTLERGVRCRAEAMIIEQKKTPGFKLKRGRHGGRCWAGRFPEEEAEDESERVRQPMRRARKRRELRRKQSIDALYEPPPF